MAELPSLGKHCSSPDCNQLDFLPLDCAHCKEIFCKEHFPANAHGCTKIPNNTVTVKKKNTDVYSCSVPGCVMTELAPITCSRCQMQVCLAHRAETDHTCPKYEAPKERMVNTKQVVDEIAKKADRDASKPKLLRNAKSQRMAAKVQLMKLKQKSTGNLSLPQEERVYFKVVPPKESGKNAVGTFVSRNWSVGRVIDAAAIACGAKNTNNVAGAPKLRLFRFQDGKNLCRAMEKPLETLVATEEVFNGDCLILEYFDEDIEMDVIDSREYTAS